MSTATPQHMKDAMLTDREREHKQDLREELAKFGLEDDVHILWDDGIRTWNDLSGMLHDQMRLPGLKGSFEQYLKMQEAQLEPGDVEDHHMYEY
jgi:hypothetical protein